MLPVAETETRTDLSEVPDEVAYRGLQVQSIAKSYDKNVVLKDVSMAVARGEVVGLLGPNGAGKTTSFYSVMGLVQPDAGRIILDGRRNVHITCK